MSNNQNPEPLGPLEEIALEALLAHAQGDPAPILHLPAQGPEPPENDVELLIQLCWEILLPALL